MAILSDGRTRRARGRLLLLAAAAGLGGCVLVDMLGMGQQPLAFSHRVHVEGEGMGCTDCHLGVEDSNDPGLPSLGLCRLCHAEEDELEQAPEQRISSLFEGDTFKAARRGALSTEIVFSHLRHAGDGQDCASCHVGIEGNERAAALAPIDMDRCTACHESFGLDQGCAVCHTSIGPDVPPPSHAHAWTRMHGAVSRSGDSSTAARCSLCHTESSCTSCHRDVRPESHTTYFDRRGHGIQARLDRQRCATCHESDSCDRCHSEVAPSSHHGGFGGVTSQHCLGCHFGFSDQSCFVCHQGTPSHALATPKPPDHTPGMNCLLCHGVTQPLPHVNKGDDCNLCHQ